MSFQPSFYQQAIHNFVDKDEWNLAVEATAGSGKTAVLIEIACRIPKHLCVCFLASNQHAAEQLKHRLPEGWKAKAIHSASVGALCWYFQREGIETSQLDNHKYRNLARAALTERPPKHL